MAMIDAQHIRSEEREFGEFRRKVRAAEVLSAAMQRLLQTIRFSGRLCIVVKNGQVLKSGYEESYFRQTEPGMSAQLQ